MRGEYKNRIQLNSVLGFVILAVIPVILIPINGEYYFQGKMYTAFLVALIYLATMEWKIEKRHLWVGSLLLLNGISTLLSDYTRISFFGVQNAPEGLLGLGICYTLFLLGSELKIEMLMKSKFFKYAIEVILLAASLISIIGVMEFFDVITPIYTILRNRSSFGIFFSSIGNRNFVGTYTILMIPICFWWTVHYRNLRGFVYSMSMISLMVISQTRSAYLSFGIIITGFVVITFKDKRERKWDTFLIGSAVLYIVGGVYLLTAILNDPRIVTRLRSLYIDLLDPFRVDAGSDRMLIWRNTLGFLFTKPLFGYGPDTFGLVYEKFTGLRWTTYPKAHNHWLQMIVSLGISYLLVYIGLIAEVCRGLLGRNNELGFVFLIIILSYELQGMFNISVGPNNYIYWLLLGMAYWFGRAESPKEII